MRIRLIAFLAWSAFAAAQESPQSAPRLEFEVASVKPSAPLTGGRVLVGGRSDPGRATYNNMSLKNLIGLAYKVKPYQISGPGFLDTDRFDITAKLPEGAGQDQVYLMLQSLLADRFKLTLHHETKELPLYELTVAKGGPKLKASVEDPNAPKPGEGPPPALPPIGKDGFPKLPPGRRGALMAMRPGGMHLTATVSSMEDLSNILGNNLGSPVIDKTGLTGTYDYSLEFALEPGQGPMAGLPPPPPPPPGGGDAGGIRPPPADNDLPNVFTAVQEQLGLKLDKKRGPLATLVVDHMERTPTEN